MIRRSGFDTDESLARELVLWVNNDAQLYRQLEQIQRNMTRKIARGTFDSEMAIKGFMWVANAGAESYSKEFGGTWHQSFPVAIRRLAAEMLRDKFLDGVEAAPESFERHVFKKGAPVRRERYCSSNVRFEGRSRGPVQKAEQQYRAALDETDRMSMVNEIVTAAQQSIDILEFHERNARSWTNYRFVNPDDRKLRDIHSTIVKASRLLRGISNLIP